MDSLDLSRLDVRKGADAGFELQLTHPVSGAPLPIFVTILGADSDEYQGALREQQRKYTERMARGKRAPVTQDEMEEQSLVLLARITRSWRTVGEVALDSKPFPAFSSAEARRLYERFPWIREQIDRAMGDRANFLPGSATS
jgi:hypothetical protein